MQLSQPPADPTLGLNGLGSDNGFVVLLWSDKHYDRYVYVDQIKLVCGLHYNSRE